MPGAAGDPHISDQETLLGSPVLPGFLLFYL